MMTDIGVTGGGNGRHMVYAAGKTDHTMDGRDMVEHHRNRPNSYRVGNPFGRILRQPKPHLPRIGIHPASRQRGNVRQVRPVSMRPKQPWQQQPVMHRLFDLHMPAARKVVFTPHHQELPAPRCKRRIGPAPHPSQRQKSQQHKVNQRQQQPLQPRPRHLPRKPAHQPITSALEEANHPRQRLRLQPHIRIHKTHHLMLCHMRTISRSARAKIVVRWR